MVNGTSSTNTTASRTSTNTTNSTIIAVLENITDALNRTNSTNSTSEKAAHESAYHFVPWKICVVLALLLCTGMFSGLNLGICSIDVSTLEMIIGSIP